MFKNKKYTIISISLLVIYLLYYCLIPIGFYSPLMMYLLLSFPLIISYFVIFKSNFKVNILLNIIILITISSGVYLISHFTTNKGYFDVKSTNCGNDIKTGFRIVGLVGSSEMLLKENAFGLYYSINDISSDRTGISDNYNIDYGFKYNKSNFYNESDFDKYSKCLPGVKLVCDKFFTIGKFNKSTPELSDYDCQNYPF
jgi:hypothetical protein